MNSGYMWREEHNESLLQVVDTAIDTTQTKDRKVSLLQVFRFKTLKKGTTTIILTHARQTLDLAPVAGKSGLSSKLI